MTLRRLCLSLALLLWTAALAFGQALPPEQRQRLLDRLQQTVATRAFVPGVNFDRLPEYLERHRSEMDQAQDAAAFTAAVNKALKEFGISHIILLSPTAARARVTGESLGFGLATEPTPQGLRVLAIQPGSPAAKLGIEQGDIITEIEGKDDPRSLPVGGERDTALVTLLRPRTGQQRHAMLVRGRFSTNQPPTLTWPTPTVAVLKLTHFTRGYNPAQVEELVRQAAGARSLVLDLRGNPGGLVSNLVHLLSLLTPPTTAIGTNVTRAMAERYQLTTGVEAKDMAVLARWNGPNSRTRKLAQAPYPGPLAVLIDKRSASSSEIVAAVLREKRGALLVGAPSAGAVLVSQYTALGDGFEVQVPLSDYVTPGGMRLEKNPLQPDVRIEQPPHNGEDPVLVAAVTALAKRASGPGVRVSSCAAGPETASSRRRTR